MVILAKLIYRFNVASFTLPAELFVKIEKLILEYELQVSQNERIWEVCKMREGPHLLMLAA